MTAELVQIVATTVGAGVGGFAAAVLGMRRVADAAAQAAVDKHARSCAARPLLTPAPFAMKDSPQI